MITALSWQTVALAALNMFQVVALAFIAAKVTKTRSVQKNGVSENSDEANH